MPQYFRLNYFHSRKDSGSYYIKLDDDAIINTGHLMLDDDEVIQMAVDTKQLPAEDSDSIVDVESLDEDEYEQYRPRKR